MARRSSSKASTEAPDTTTEETAVSTATEEVQPEAAEKPTEAKPINLDAFTASVDAAYDTRDTTTGTVPEGPLAEVTKAYRDLDGVKAKNAGKNLVNERLKARVNELDIVGGKAYMMISEALTAGAGAKAERPPADPTEAFVQRYAAIALGLSLLTIPEGVDEASATTRAQEQVESLRGAAQEYMVWAQAPEDSRGDEPEVVGTVKQAVKLAMGKTAKVGGGGRVGGSHEGPRHSIEEHIRQTFADEEPGTFKSIAEIRNFKSEEYGDTPPSAGAISARLFPQSGKCSLDFVKPDTNEKGNRGAVKL